LPWESHARFLHRDQDGIFGHEFLRRVDALELVEVVSARGSPWQNGYCERVIGALRRVVAKAEAGALHHRYDRLTA
jgi:hypothetical protein